MTTNNDTGIPFSATRRRLMAGVGLSGLLSASCSTMPSRTSRFSALNAEEYVVAGAHVLSMDPSIGEIPVAFIHVRNGAIISVSAEPVPANIPVFDAKGLIALPGFVDTHWHMWGASARNMAGEDIKTGYFPYSRSLGSQFTPEDNARGVRLALAEAISSGITTVHNWSHNLMEPAYADSELQVHREAGSRARFSYGYSRKTKNNETLPMADIARVQKQYFSNGRFSQDGLLSMGVASLGPEANSIELCKAEWAAARQLGLPITTHIGVLPKKPGAHVIDGISLLAENGLLGPDLLLIHATNNTQAEFEMLGKTCTPVSVSPYTELRTGFGFTPIHAMLRAGVIVSLSVDTTMLAGNADMFAIMKAVQNIADGSAQSEFSLPPHRVLEMATMGGARALGLEKYIGSLTPGKRADIVLVRSSDLNMAPMTNATRMIVQSAQPGNIEAVIVDGKPLLSNGTLTTLDATRVASDARETIERITGMGSRAAKP